MKLLIEVPIGWEMEDQFPAWRWITFKGSPAGIGTKRNSSIELGSFGYEC